MSCIVGLVDNGKVFIGGDSAASNDTFIQTLQAHKVFRVGPVLIGCAGSHRVLQILRHKLDLEESALETEEYVVSHVIEKIRETFKEKGVLQALPEGEEFEGTFLLGYKGRLFTVCSDFSAQEYVDGCDSIGSGREYALGSMAATYQLPPEERIILALTVAARYSPSVCQPFYVEVL